MLLVAFVLGGVLGTTAIMLLQPASSREGFETNTASRERTMHENNQTYLWRYALFGFVLGLIAAGVNLILGLTLGIYFTLDTLGAILLPIIAARAVYAEYAKRKEKARFRSFTRPC